MNMVIKIGGRRFTWWGSYWRRGEAKVEAEKLRKKGYNARVLRKPNHWQVYWRKPNSL